MKNMTKLAVSAFISVCSMTSSTATPIHDRDEQIKPKPSMMGNYDITDQSQVWKTFKEDANSGIFSKLPSDILKKIFRDAKGKKSLLLVSRGFNSLYMSGFLPVTFKIDGRKSNGKNFKQDALVRFRNVQHLELWNLPRVKDVSALGGVQNLMLWDCPRVKDVSALGSVQHLKLWDLPLVDNVSALESVQHLVLRDLPKVEDVSALGKNGQEFYLDGKKVIND